MTELVFVLDWDGSTRGLEHDTIGGFNSIIEKQKKTEGEAVCTVYACKPLSTDWKNASTMMLKKRGK